MDEIRMNAVREMRDMMATEVCYDFNLGIILHEYYDKAPALFDSMYQMLQRARIARGG